MIAVLTSYIAFQQWRTNKRKVRLDVFDKRFGTYETVRDTVSSIVSNGRIESDALFRFWIKSSDAKFLFGKTIGTLVKEIYETSPSSCNWQSQRLKRLENQVLNMKEWRKRGPRI